MQNLPRRKYKLDKPATKRELKNLMAAEARYRYELLAEQRELTQNLADFWETSFDKVGNSSAKFHKPADGH
jgi:hypothetical protein